MAPFVASKMQHCHAAAVSLLLLACCMPWCTAQQFSWSLCDATPVPVTVKSVELSPDPPVIGSPATFLVQGSIDEEVDGGAVEIHVSFGGIEIFSQSQDLCANTKCPVAPGDVAITLVQDLPPIAPPGDYELKVVGTDTMGGELLCLNVKFTLVPPMGHLTARGSAGAAAARKLLQLDGQA